MKRQTQLAALIAALAVATGGCSSGMEGAAADKRVELLTWWLEPTELRAIDAVIALHEQRYPGVDVAVLSASSREAMVSDVAQRLEQGNPPAAFQENLGDRTRSWAEHARPLDHLAQDWGEAFAPSVLDLVRTDDRLIAVPLAITRNNLAYYNKRVLDELELEVPRSEEEFLRWLDQLEEAGYEHPLCIGDLDNWVSALVLLGDLLPAHAGAEFARRYWAGELSADEDALRSALGFASRVVPAFNPDFGSLDMASGVTLLMLERAREDQCVMTPMGDWGGAILSADFELGRDFVQEPWPGTEGVFVLAGDAFIALADEPETYDFMTTLASHEGQVAFNASKGSVPARTMSPEDYPSFGALTRANLSDLASGTVLPTYLVIGSGDFPWSSLYQLTHDFFLTGDPEPILDFMAQNYGALAH